MVAKPDLSETQPDLRAVRDFWIRMPLFVGETRQAAGAREFFTEHLDSAGSIRRPFSGYFLCGYRAREAGGGCRCGIGIWVHSFPGTRRQR